MTVFNIKGLPMRTLISFLKTFWKDERGLTVFEYVLGATLLAAALLAVFTGYGTALTAKITAVLATF